MPKNSTGAYTTREAYANSQGHQQRTVNRIDKVEQELYYWDRISMGGFVETMEKMLLN